MNDGRTPDSILAGIPGWEQAEIEPLETPQLFVLASLHDLLGDREAFVETFSAWCDAPDAHPTADDHLRLALELETQGRVDAALPWIERAVAIDPGHPGGGSTGPTGLFEGDVNLEVARRLAALLETAGAEPILIRADARPLGLYERTRRARDAVSKPLEIDELDPRPARENVLLRSFVAVTAVVVPNEEG